MSLSEGIVVGFVGLGMVVMELGGFRTSLSEGIGVGFVGLWWE